jgi:hypothetical protein
MITVTTLSLRQYSGPLRKQMISLRHVIMSLPPTTSVMTRRADILPQRGLFGIRVYIIALPSILNDIFPCLDYE